MNSPDRESLLNDLVAEAAGDQFRADMLAHTLAQAKRRRATKRLARIGGGAAVVVMAIVFFWKSQAPSPPPAVQGARVAEHKPPVEAELKKADPPVRLITDDELLARFPDRAVALVGPPDRRRFVFLD